MARRASIPHAVPGRMRVKVSGAEEERAEALAAIHRRLGLREGVHAIRTSERTGSALITYDPEELDPESLVELLREAHEAFDDLAPPAVREAAEHSASELAGAIRARLGLANRAVLGATHRKIDLRMLVPVGFAGLSLRQLLAEGVGFAAIPWYVLAYYSFDSFIKLHADQSRATQT